MNDNGAGAATPAAVAPTAAGTANDGGNNTAATTAGGGTAAKTSSKTAAAATGGATSAAGTAVAPGSSAAPNASAPSTSATASAPAPSASPAASAPAANASATPSAPAPAAESAPYSSLEMGGDATAAEQGNDASPLSFKIGNAEFTPGGFLDFTSVWRSADVGSGIGTNFAGIPLNNSVTGRVGEFRESAQNSRLSLRVDSNYNGMPVLGYVEMDFLGNQPTNIAVTSNSATLRMRVYFVDVRRGAWEVMAGQDWSLLTANRVGTSVMPADVFYSMAMDTNYLAGMVWSRQPQLRLMYHANSQWTWALSLENPEQYIGGSSGAPTVTLPSSPSVSAELDSGGTSYSDPGFAPDVITKLAFDSSPDGKGVHFEIAGLESTFRLYDPATGITNRKEGGGGAVNFNIDVAGNFHLISNNFISDGGGRYLFGMAPDLIVTNAILPSPVHADSWVEGFEDQATPGYLLYGYYSGAYIGQDFDLSGTSPVGYGYNNSANRVIQEGTIGVIHTFFKNPNYGAMQLITQYSYLMRDFWTTANPANAHTSMVYADLRYVLP